MKKIYARGKMKEKYAIVDDCYFDELSKYKWYCDKRGKFYCSIYVNGKSKNVAMHRMIIFQLRKTCIDHKNGLPNDNRLENLRFCTPSENSRNRRAARSVSGYKGIYQRPKYGTWVAKINIDGKTRQVGSFKTAREAALAYDDAAREFHKEFAVTNKMLGLV